MLDLAHEYILTLCYALGCAAVLAPLLLLFGLRFGAIETLHHRLLADPRNREIRPKFGQTFPRDWFREMEERSDVAFLIPQVRQIAAGIEARRDNSNHSFTAIDVMPTAAGDPLLEEYGASGPGPRECILTASSAADLDVQVGGHVQVKVGRIRNSGGEEQSVTLRVAAILPEQAGSLRLMYLGLPLVEAIEQYKDGLAVPSLSWEDGATGEAIPAYDGVVVCSGERLGQQGAGLINGTGLTEITSLKAEDAVSVLGYEVAEDSVCVLLTASGALITESSLQAVNARLRKSSCTIYPFVRPRKATITTNDPKLSKSVEIVSVPADIMGKMGIGRADAGLTPIGYIAAEDAELIAKASPNLNIIEGKRDLSIPMTLGSASVPRGILFVGIELGGQLNLLRDRPLEFEKKTGLLRPLRRSYPSFRLYTRTLEDVVKIERLFHKNGIEVYTQSERIQDVLSIDRNLGILFWLIACVAIMGGLSSLATSLYASLERKRRNLGVLRLLGVPLRSLVILPVTQGMGIVTIGLAVSLGLYFAGSSVADRLFSQHLKGVEHLCTINISHLIITAALTQMLAATAGFLANVRISLSDPTNILRAEI